MAAYLNFLATYNNGGATPNIPEARNPLIFKAFRAPLTLNAARYVAATDVVVGGDLLLGLGQPPVQPVAAADDVRLA